MSKLPANYCPVCFDKGGWDRRTNIARARQPRDDKDSWMSCIYCGISNSLSFKVDIPRGK